MRPVIRITLDKDARARAIAWVENEAKFFANDVKSYWCFCTFGVS